LAGLAILWSILDAGVYIYYRTHKPELIAKANTFLNDRFKGSINIKDISLNLLSNFPYPALQINGVTIDDSVYARTGQHTVYLQKIRVIPGFEGIWRGAPVIRKVVLENGLFFLYKDSSGYTNGYVWTSKQPRSAKTKKGGRPSLPLRVEIHQVDLTIADSVRHKLYGFEVRRLQLDQNGAEADSSAWRVEMDVTVRSLAFKTSKGSFLKDQDVRGHGDMGFSMDKAELAFKDMALTVNRQALRVDGDFRFDTANSFRLHIAAPSVDFPTGRAWLPWKISRKLDSLSFEHPLALDASIEGVLARGNDPKILVRWTVAHDKVSGYIGTIEDCSFTGYFNNHIYDSLPPSDANSLICADSLVGKYRGSIPFRTKRLEIVRLDTAVLAFDLVVHNPVSDWGDLVQSDDLSFDKGDVSVDLRFQYPLTDSSGIIPSINGTIDINDAEISYDPRDVKITNGQVRLRFDHQDLLLDRISGDIGKSPLVISGNARNFLRLTSDTGEMVLDWKVYSPSLDGQELLPFLGKGGQKSHRSRAIASSGAGRLLDRFIRRCRVNTDLQVGKLTYKNFSATSVGASILLDNGVLTLPRLTLQTAKGNLNVWGSVRPYGDDNKVRLAAVFKNIDLPTLFYAFDDFGQASLTSKNLTGVLNAQADLSILLTDKGKKVPGSLDGTLQFSVDSGALVNFSPLTKLSNFAFKNRDFTNVRFSKLYDTFRFSSDTLTFDQMEVQSTVLEMFVAGVYKLDGSYTNADIQVPFNNLKKRKGLPDNVGVDVHHGLSVFVHAYNTGEEPLHYKFGLFKKKVAH
jgi:hypothetical protein